MLSLSSPRSAWPTAAVVLLGLVIGLLHLTPNLLLKRAIEADGGTYLLVQITHHGDTLIYYLSRAREVADGFWPSSDLHIPEYKSGPYIVAPIPQLLLGSLIRAAGDVQTAYLAALFIFPAILFWAFYILGRFALPGGRLGASLFALIGIFTPIALNLPRAFYGFQLFADTFAKNFLPVVRTPLTQLFLARVEDPLLTLPFHLIALALVWRFWNGPSTRRALFLALAWGALLYTYYIYFAFVSVLIGFLFLWHLLRARGREIRPWLILFGAVLAIAVPFVMNSLEFRALPQQPELLLRSGIELGRAFRTSVWDQYLAYALTGLIVWALFRKQDAKFMAFALASLVTLAALWNIQLVLGFNLPPDHWTKASGPALFLILSVALAEVLRMITARLDLPSVRKTLAALAILLMALLVAKKVTNALVFVNPPEDFRREYSFPSGVADSWRWIQENIPPESVVLTNSYVSTIYLVSYTSVNPYLAFSENTIAGDDELAERFLTMHRLFGVSPERLVEYLAYRKRTADVCAGCAAHTAFNLSKAPRYLFGHTFDPQSRFDALTKDSSYAIAPGRLKAMLSRYGTLRPRWEDFPGAYVYHGPWERELSTVNLKNNSSLQLIYDAGGVEMYRVR